MTTSHRFPKPERPAGIAFATLSAVVALCLVAAGDVRAQSPTSSRFLRGRVTARGVPIRGVTLYDKGTLAGAETDADGRFALAIGDSATTVALTTRRIGYRPLDTLVTTEGQPVALEITAFTALVAMTVRAGQYESSAAKTATLTPLEVATTPGANADVNGAIKTLPGVQGVDEGSGLFVRGGDLSETRTVVDGAPLFSAVQFEAPTGSVAGTINPFLLDKIVFSAGGFGAGMGNALSAVVELKTAGRPERSFVSGNVSVLNAAMSAGLSLPHGVGLTGTIGASDLTQMLLLNGNARGFNPAPHGGAVSGSAVWTWRPTGTLKLFALRQENRYAVGVEEPSYTGLWDADRVTHVAVLSWEEFLGSLRVVGHVSSSGMTRAESVGAYVQANDLRLVMARQEVAYEFDPRVRLEAGAEVERLTATFNGRLPATPWDRGPGAPTVPVRLARAGDRVGGWLAITTRPTSATSLTVGVRSDASGYAADRSVDPRASLGWVIAPSLTIFAAWGRYHQAPDPAFFSRAPQDTLLPWLSAEQAMLGAQFGEGKRTLRVELWAKRYRDLIGFTREAELAGGLDGRAFGADVFARGQVAGIGSWRLTYSTSRSHRDDPNTRRDAPAAFDITHTVTAIAERQWGSGWSAGVAWRSSSGRPVTDIASATLDARSGQWVPQWGAPNAERLPAFGRLDVTLSRARPLPGGRFVVGYVGLNNLLNTENVYSYTWNRDYSVRSVVPSFQNRSLFFGMNFVVAGS